MLETVYQLCPPLFSLGTLRIDSPTSNVREIYEQDKEYFNLHKGRNLYIRGDYRGEFDIEVDVVGWLQIPRLHVLVTQLTVGVHQITPVYRGKQFFYDEVATDSEVALILIEMSRRKGMNVEEWQVFEAVWLERQTIALTQAAEAIQ
jgi:hypothetical protein